MCEKCLELSKPSHEYRCCCYNPQENGIPEASSAGCLGRGCSYQNPYPFSSFLPPLKEYKRISPKIVWPQGTSRQLPSPLWLLHLNYEKESQAWHFRDPSWSLGSTNLSQHAMSMPVKAGKAKGDLKSNMGETSLSPWTLWHIAHRQHDLSLMRRLWYSQHKCTLRCFQYLLFFGSGNKKSVLLSLNLS